MTDFNDFDLLDFYNVMFELSNKEWEVGDGDEATDVLKRLTRYLAKQPPLTDEELDIVESTITCFEEIV